MASIGRLTPAVFSSTVDTTVALANINFDFSLLKVEAPKEFHGLGHSLSNPRRHEAETGTVHTTARKLGAIFKSVLPEMPRLVGAYGLRASEIAKASTSTPQRDYGIFKNQVGIDGTSIWAAATSGPSAIQVHLLACLLARIWETPEAISIWVEMIESRKREIEDHLDRTGSVDMTTYMAARQQLSRNQLAEWDASARAWLRIADAVMSRQQKQLLLIIGNLENHVNLRPQLYENVMEVWKAGMEGMERLLGGSPQQMQSGELLLGLSAWHLYPDLNVLDAATAIVRQHDPLIHPNGILTIGLQMHETSSSKGLHWSLPLAHLRYYGDPVPCKKKIGAEGWRLSLDEFHQAVLGCILGGWNIVDAHIEAAAQWIVDLSDLITRLSPENNLHTQNSWLSLLSKTASTFIKSTGVERRIYKQLINLGRKYSSFLGNPSHPFFGLSETERFLRLAKGQENKIQILRELVAGVKIRENNAIIRYISDKTGKEEFATASPRVRRVPKRTNSDAQKESLEHTRWISSSRLPFLVPTDHKMDYSPSMSTFGDTNSHVSAGAIFLAQAEANSHAPAEVVQAEIEARRLALTEAQRLAREEHQRFVQGKARAEAQVEAQAITDFFSQKKHYESIGESVLSVEDEPFRTLVKENTKGMRIIWGGVSSVSKEFGLDDYEPWYGEIKHFEHWLGDLESAALFIRMKTDAPKMPKYVSLSNLQTYFAGDNLDTTILLEVFHEAIESLGPTYLQSLKAITTIDGLYKKALHATIDVKVFQYSLQEAQWLRGTQRILTVGDNSNEQGHSDSNKSRSFPPEEVEMATLDDIERGPSSSKEASPECPSHFFEEAIEQVATDSTERTRSTLNPPKPRRSAANLSKALNEIFQPILLEHERVFSCVLMFESGQFNIPPEQLRNVMAISSEDSLFIAAPLLNDPAKPLAHTEIYHVMGNIGRAGIALLVPPVAPRIKSAGIQNWNVVNRDYWEGQLQDCFQDTSLHLSFTGFSVPVDVGYSGAQDTELYILESVVSVHGGGKWIGDLDILKALRHPSLLLRPKVTNKDCISLATHSEAPISTCNEGHAAAYQRNNWELVALENWMELLEVASENSILLAKGNWQARLAATSICIAQGRPVYILTDQVCWSCIEAEISRILARLGSPIIFIG